MFGGDKYIIAGIYWPPCLISQLFASWLFLKVAVCFTPWLFSRGVTSISPKTAGLKTMLYEQFYSHDYVLLGATRPFWFHTSQCTILISYITTPRKESLPNQFRTFFVINSFDPLVDPLNVPFFVSETLISVTKDIDLFFDQIWYVHYWSWILNSIHNNIIAVLFNTQHGMLVSWAALYTVVYLDCNEIILNTYS